MSDTVRFVNDDRYGAWSAGEVASDIGRESDHPDAPNIRCIQMQDGQVLALHDPYGRGIVERVHG